MKRGFSIFCMVLLGLGPAACDDDDSVGLKGDLVGGPCVTSSDCAESCLTSGDFPQGTCTIACLTDADCPGGTRCVAVENGVCLLECDLPSDCRPGYSCKGEDNMGFPGDSLVCIDD